MRPEVIVSRDAVKPTIPAPIALGGAGLVGTLSGMSEHVQIRLISLLEEAANSFEQLETLANRTLREIPAEAVDQVELRPLERDVMEPDNEPGSEMDHVVIIRYRAEIDPDAGI